MVNDLNGPRTQSDVLKPLFWITGKKIKHRLPKKIVLLPEDEAELLENFAALPKERVINDDSGDGLDVLPSSSSLFNLTPISKRSSSGKRQKMVLKALSPHRTQNLLILFRKYPPPDELLDCILDGRFLDLFSSDRIRELHSYIPSVEFVNRMEEIEELGSSVEDFPVPIDKSGINDRDTQPSDMDWDLPEKYLRVLASIPENTALLHAAYLCKDILMESGVTSLVEKLDDITLRCQQLLSSSSLEFVLEMCLAVGNRMNRGTRRGLADHVPIESISLFERMFSAPGESKSTSGRKTPSSAGFGLGRTESVSKRMSDTGGANRSLLSLVVGMFIRRKRCDVEEHLEEPIKTTPGSMRTIDPLLDRWRCELSTFLNRSPCTSLVNITSDCDKLISEFCGVNRDYINCLRPYCMDPETNEDEVSASEEIEYYDIKGYLDVINLIRGCREPISNLEKKVSDARDAWDAVVKAYSLSRDLQSRSDDALRMFQEFITRIEEYIVIQT